MRLRPFFTSTHRGTSPRAGAWHLIPRLVGVLALLLGFFGAATAPASAGQVDPHLHGWLEIHVHADALPDPAFQVTVHDESEPGPSELSEWNGSGIFSLRVPVGRYRVKAGAWSTTDPADHALTTWGGNTTRDVDATIYTVSQEATTIVKIDLLPAAMVSGSIVFADGAPAKKVQYCYTTPERGSGLGCSVADKHGEYSIRHLATGWVDVEARAKGMEPATVRVYARQDETVVAPTIVLRPPRSGKVKVKVARKDLARWVVVYDTKTKEAFPLKEYVRPNDVPARPATITRRLPEGRYRLVAAGMQRATKPFRVKDGKTTDVGYLDNDFTLVGWITLKGRLRAADGTELNWRHARLRVLDKNGTTPEGEVLAGDWGDGVVYPKGAYWYTLKAPGNYTFIAQSKQGWSVKKKLTIPKNALETKYAVHRESFRLKPPFKVSGRITHHGKPVQGVTVTLRSTSLAGERSVVTGPNGKYVFKRLPRALPKHTITVFDPYVAGYLKKTVKIAGGADTVKNIELKTR